MNWGEKSGDDDNNNANAGEGEGMKRKSEEVARTPERAERGNYKTPGEESMRTRGPDSKKNKNDITDFFSRMKKNRKDFTWNPGKGGAAATTATAYEQKNSESGGGVARAATSASASGGATARRPNLPTPLSLPKAPSNHLN